MLIDELKKRGITGLEDAIEFLSKNQKGLYFLPNNLAELIAEIAQSNSPTNCIDINSNMGEVLTKCKGIEKRIGIDANSQSVELSNYLNPEIVFNNINPFDFVTKEKFDTVICMPFGLKSDKSVHNTSSEERYISKSLDLLSNNGKAIFILPYSVLTNPIFQNIRRQILQEYGLKQIISLPTNVLKSTGIKLCILIIGKQKRLSTEFKKIDNCDFTVSDYYNTDSKFTISKENLSNRWDYSYHNPNNREFEKELEKHKSEKLENLVEVIQGKLYKKEELSKKGTYLFLKNQQISDGELIRSENDVYLSKDILNLSEKRFVLHHGDILIPRKQRNNEAFYIHSDMRQNIIASQDFIILRGNNAEYVAAYLNTDYGFELFYEQVFVQRGSVYPILTTRILKEILIPILPIDDLEHASKSRLKRLTYDELIEISDKYIALKAEFHELKTSATMAHEAQLDKMQDILQEVFKYQKVMSGKMDVIKSMLTELTMEFKEIKELPREIDEKLIRLNKNIDDRLKTLIGDQRHLDLYITEIKQWFDFYDILESNSQKYLPEAEYIFDHISKLDNPDYSPFIIQYCRALENELLKFPS